LINRDAWHGIKGPYTYYYLLELDIPTTDEFPMLYPGPPSQSCLVQIDHSSVCMSDLVWMAGLNLDRIRTDD
jgi:hypothetical protein